MRASLLPCCLLVGAATVPVVATARVVETDTPLRIIQTVDPIYPLRVATVNLPEGEARVLVLVDETGRLADALVLGYTLPEFADAALATLREWRYEPARRDGRPVGTRREVVFAFEPSKTVVNLVDRDLVANRFDRFFGLARKTVAVSARELDAPLRATHAPQPPNPVGRGRAVVDFYVDQQGRPRLPVVVSSDTPEFAAAALDALDQWRFAPPVARGEPVAVRVRQEFRF